MGTLFKNYTPADVKNTIGGYAPNAWLAPLEWFDTFAEPEISTPTQLAGDTTIIKDSHTFLTGKNPIRIYCAPDSVEGDGDIIGEQLALRFQWKPKLIIPGDTAEVLELIKNSLNLSFILFVKGAECGATDFVQFGCDCNPMTFIPGGGFKSGNTAQGRKQYELTAQGNCKYLYKGTLPELSAPVIV